mgnify:CR=1 FL=1
MSIATIGAFIIGEYPEGVAVMLFYAVGELFQSAAVNKAKGNIVTLKVILLLISIGYTVAKWVKLKEKK